jgi:hypothetical protein
VTLSQAPWALARKPVVGCHTADELTLEDCPKLQWVQATMASSKKSLFTESSAKLMGWFGV